MWDGDLSRCLRATLSVCLEWCYFKIACVMFAVERGVGGTLKFNCPKKEFRQAIYSRMVFVETYRRGEVSNVRWYDDCITGRRSWNLPKRLSMIMVDIFCIVYRPIFLTQYFGNWRYFVRKMRGKVEYVNAIWPLSWASKYGHIIRLFNNVNRGRYEILRH